MAAEKDDKSYPELAYAQADDESVATERDPKKYGTKEDQHDMYRMGKDQKLRVSLPLTFFRPTLTASSETLASFLSLASV
jgi:hypothetical protein